MLNIITSLCSDITIILSSPIAANTLNGILIKNIRLVLSIYVASQTCKNGRALSALLNGSYELFTTYQIKEKLGENIVAHSRLQAYSTLQWNCPAICSMEFTQQFREYADGNNARMRG